VAEVVGQDLGAVRVAAHRGCGGGRGRRLRQV